MVEKTLDAREVARVALDDAIHDAIEILSEGYSYNPEIDAHLISYPTARRDANNRFETNCKDFDGECEKHTHLTMSDPFIGEVWGEFGMHPDEIDLDDAKRCIGEIETNANLLGLPYGPEHSQLKHIVKLREADDGVEMAKETAKNAFEIDFRKALRVLPSEAEFDELDKSHIDDVDLMRSLFLLEAFQAELKLAAKAAIGDGYSMDKDKIEWYLTSAINFSVELGNMQPLNFYFAPQSRVESDFGRSRAGGIITDGHYPFSLEQIIKDISYTYSERKKWDPESLTKELKKIAVDAESHRQDIIDSFSLRTLNMKEGEKPIWVKTRADLRNALAKGCSCSTDLTDHTNPHRFSSMRRMDNVLVLQCQGGHELQRYPSDSKVVILAYDAKELEEKIPSYQCSVEDIDYVLTHKDAYMTLSDGD